MQTYVSGSSLRIFLKLCSILGHNSWEKSLNEISKTILFLAKWAILAQFQPKIAQIISQDLL